MRLLVVKRDKLGDLLLTRPVLDRARALAPDAEIHLLANDYNAWVARDRKIQNLTALKAVGHIMPAISVGNF